MSRNRKVLEQQVGNLKVEEKERRAIEQQAVRTGKEDIERAPSYLIDALAKKEYKRIMKDLNKIDIVGNLDLSSLVGYCNAYSGYRRATKELSEQELTVTKYTASGDSYAAENPLINIQKKYADEMRKFASACGLTIDSRLKAAAMKVDKIESEIEDEFGDI